MKKRFKEFGEYKNMPEKEQKKYFPSVRGFLGFYIVLLSDPCCFLVFRVPLVPVVTE